MSPYPQKPVSEILELRRAETDPKAVRSDPSRPRASHKAAAPMAPRAGAKPLSGALEVTGDIHRKSGSPPAMAELPGYLRQAAR